MPRKKSTSWTAIKKELLSDPETAQAYRELAPEYELVRQVIRARQAQGLSQAELAALIGTRQSNISRLERGDSNPSLAFLKRVARGLGKELSISFQ